MTPAHNNHRHSSAKYLKSLDIIAPFLACDHQEAKSILAISFSASSIMTAFVNSFLSVSSLTRPSSFSGSKVSSHCSTATARWSMVQSKSIPFMEAPPALDGTAIGDVGFGKHLSHLIFLLFHARQGSNKISKTHSWLNCFFLSILDPFGISKYANFKFLQEAEIKV